MITVTKTIVTFIIKMIVTIISLYLSVQLVGRWTLEQLTPTSSFPVIISAMATSIINVCESLFSAGWNACFYNVARDDAHLQTGSRSQLVVGSAEKERTIDGEKERREEGESEKGILYLLAERVWRKFLAFWRSRARLNSQFAALSWTRPMPQGAFQMQIPRLPRAQTDRLNRTVGGSKVWAQ